MDTICPFHLLNLVCALFHVQIFQLSSLRITAMAFKRLQHWFHWHPMMFPLLIYWTILEAKLTGTQQVFVLSDTVWQKATW